MIQQSINQLLNIGAIGAKLEQAQTADKLKSAEDVTDATVTMYNAAADRDQYTERMQLEDQQNLNKRRAKYGKGIVGMRRGIQKEQHLAGDISAGIEGWEDKYREQAAQ